MSNLNLKHKHVFRYTVEHSTLDGITPKTVEFVLSGDIGLTEIVDTFANYLRASGFCIDSNKALELVAV